MAKDLFSKQAADYAKWRPGYPPELVEYIVSFVQERKAAWDCATGNGQAAVLLAAHFEHIYATDLSTAQLSHAKPHHQITYSQSPAEHTPFNDNTFDLVTVAQAYHWFDHEAFCREARRVCKPNAVVAIWGYDLCYFEDDALNNRFNSFYVDVTGPYWDAARKYIDEHYRNVYFDFEEIPVDKEFIIRMHWTIRDLEGYLNSWSAVQKYISVHNANPVDDFIKEIAPLWTNDTLKVEFPIFLRMGKA